MKTTKGMLRGLAIAVMVLISSVHVLAGIQQTYYVSPSGSDANAGTIDKPFLTLTKARDMVRKINTSMTGDIIIYLRAGTYTMTSGFMLSEDGTYHDSGTNGYNIIYSAYNNEEVMISGGKSIGGWAVHDAGKNIYKAYLGTGLITRQLYVNCKRAIRARSSVVADGTLPAGWSTTSTGFNAPDATMATWGNIADMEICSRNQWRDHRCGIASITGKSVVMQEPAYSKIMGSTQSGLRFVFVTFIENAYELLDAEGEWYHNRSTGYIYYKPRAGENMSTACVVAPVAQKLLYLYSPSYSKPIHNIQFKGIQFQYATYLEPDDNNGYADRQSGQQQTRWTPGCIRLVSAKDILFERNRFEHLGGAGLSMEMACKNVKVIGNVVRDISGSGITLNENTIRTDAAQVIDNILIQNNYITKIGLEFTDADAVFGGIVSNVTVDHNEMHELPYSGIGMGFVWGYATSQQKNNKITNNLIYEFNKVRYDGGGIYTLGDQPNSVMSGNYIHHDYNLYGAVYMDEGTCHYNMFNNVMAYITIPSHPTHVPYWLFMNWKWKPQNAPLYNNVHDNFSDISAKWVNTADVTNTFSNNITVTNHVWPAAAQSIISNAGIQSAYLDIKNNLTSCPCGGPVVTYTLMVTSGSGSGSYEKGDVISISANAPAAGKIFDKWTGATTGITNINSASTNITMPGANATITATYRDNITYTLTVNSGNGGGSFDPGEVVDISANTPAAGKTFDKWTGATSGIASITAANTTITMPAANTTITATYKDILYSLTVSNGTGSGSYPLGTKVTVKANAAPAGKEFDKWIGAISGIADVNASTTTFTVTTANSIISATYKFPTSTDELAAQVSCYPNPAITFITVVNSSEYQVLQIIAVSGVVEWSETISGRDVITLPVEGLSKGMYMIQMTTTDGSMMQLKFKKE